MTRRIATPFQNSSNDVEAGAFAEGRQAALLQLLFGVVLREQQVVKAGVGGRRLIWRRSEVIRPIKSEGSLCLAQRVALRVPSAANTLPGGRAAMFMEQHAHCHCCLREKKKKRAAEAGRKGWHNRQTEAAARAVQGQGWKSKGSARARAEEHESKGQSKGAVPTFCNVIAHQWYWSRLRRRPVASTTRSKQ